MSFPGRIETRIMGQETEYGLALNTRTISIHEVQRVSSRMRNCLSHPYQPGSRDWLENGGCFYLDVNCHPETATPECTNALDVVTYARALDLAALGVAVVTARQLSTESDPLGISLIKNNYVYDGPAPKTGPAEGLVTRNTFACHENFLVRRQFSFDKLCADTLPFFASRVVWAGSGVVLRGRFRLSQRADFIVDDVSSLSTRSRPMILTRDEPLGDERVWRRFQPISADSNMIELPAYLRMGVTDLVISASEDGVSFADLAFAKPANHVMRRFSGDPTLQRRARTVSGREMTGIEVQEAYLERVEAAAQRWDLNAVQKDVLGNWRRVLEVLADDPQRLEGELDWVTKLCLIERQAKRNGLSLDSRKAEYLDVAYHILGGPVSTRLASHYATVGRVTTDTAILAAVSGPPQDTRAKIRGGFLTTMRHELRRHASGGWDRVGIASAPSAVLLKDPYQTSSVGVDTLIAGLRGSSFI